MWEAAYVVDEVRRWAVQAGGGVVADGAAGHALRCYLGGASVGEACREGRRLVASYLRHPSGAVVHPPLARAS